MPSPFPGMDPYIEGQEWEDFHFRFINAIADRLAPGLRPRYFARVEKRVYLEHTQDGEPRRVRPDLAIGMRPGAPRPQPGAGTATAPPPFEIPQLVPEEIEEPFLEIRTVDGHEVIAVVEVLSPTNKRAGSDGRREYLVKREAVMRGSAHLIELDLLRGGERVPMAKPLPPLDYYALVSRAERRPVAEIWPTRLRGPFPEIPVPLAGDDPALTLDLQAVFNTVYERAGYDYSLDYTRGTVPPLNSQDLAWVQEITLPLRRGNNE